MYATLLGNVINVILNYFLIFGFWIFPKMGVEGAAIGTLFLAVPCYFLWQLYVRFNKRFMPMSKYSFQKPIGVFSKKSFV